MNILISNCLCFDKESKFNALSKTKLNVIKTFTKTREKQSTESLMDISLGKLYESLKKNSRKISLNNENYTYYYKF